MNEGNPSAWRFALALMALSMAGSAAAEIVTVTFALEVESRQIGDFAGAYDPSFVPFSSTATMSFDSTWVEGYAYSPAPGINEIVASFVGQNQFTSGLTALVPWGPPFPADTDVEYDRALYLYAAFDDPGDGPPEWNNLFWDKRHHYDDTDHHLEYRHAFAVEAYRDTVYPIAPGFQDFGTDDLMEYLFMAQAQQIPFRFGEYGWIYDYAAHQSVSYVEYKARATIADISAPSLVPAPPAAWLMGTAIAAILGRLKRRAGR
jgi:hypothetical protein